MHLFSKHTKGKSASPLSPPDSALPHDETSIRVPLVQQLPAWAPQATKIRLSILATAMVDALGGPPEFHKRFSFELITTMTPNHNFGLPPGIWTDDTSMMLCLARSLATYTAPHKPDGKDTKGGFSETHQLDAYSRWHDEGVLSAIGKCFDIGNTIGSALHIYARHPKENALPFIRAELGGENSSGNGSLMRVLPIGLAYWRDIGEASRYARRSSQTTHPNEMCQEACELWTALIVRTLQKSGSPNSGYSKLDLLDYIATFAYTNRKLREALTVPLSAPLRPGSDSALEAYYWASHPLLRLIRETQAGKPIDNKNFPYCLPTEEKLPSTGYVLHTLLAALYCFFATETFEHGAIMAINLGNDADTVGAVYAGLAGCWYAAEEDQGGKNVFWTKLVTEWKASLVKRDLVELVAEELVTYTNSLENH